MAAQSDDRKADQLVDPTAVQSVDPTAVEGVVAPPHWSDQSVDLWWANQSVDPTTVVAPHWSDRSADQSDDQSVNQLANPSVDPAAAEEVEEKLIDTEAEIWRITKELEARGVAPTLRSKSGAGASGGTSTSPKIQRSRASGNRDKDRGKDKDKDKDKDADKGNRNRRSSSSASTRSSDRGGGSRSSGGGGGNGGRGRNSNSNGVRGGGGGSRGDRGPSSPRSSSSRLSSAERRAAAKPKPRPQPLYPAGDAGTGDDEVASDGGGWKPKVAAFSTQSVLDGYGFNGFGKYLDLDGMVMPKAVQDTVTAGTRYAGVLADSASKTLGELQESAASSLSDVMAGGLKYFNADPVVVELEPDATETAGGDSDNSGAEVGAGAGAGAGTAVGAGAAAGLRPEIGSGPRSGAVEKVGAETGANSGDGGIVAAVGTQSNDTWHMDAAAPPPLLPRREPTSGPACDPGCEDSKVCIEGVCVCPVLYRGSNCSLPLELPEDPKVNRCLMGVNHPRFADAIEGKYGDHAPKGMRVPAIARTRHIATTKESSRDLSKLHMFDTCAVVGSSGSVRRLELGADIDAHDAVFRFNEAPTEGYQKWVGNRTTLRIQNMDFCGKGERDGETCLAYTATRDKLCPRSLAAKAKGQKLNCRLVYPSHRDSKYIYWYWRMNSVPRVKDVACAATNGRCVNKMSAGYYGIMLALNLCGKVDLYGFGSAARKEMPHYFPKPSAQWDRTEWALRHHWGFERFCLGKFRTGVVPGVEMKI